MYLRLFIFALMVAAAVCGHILLKLGATDIHKVTNLRQWISWHLIVGIGLFGLAAVLYILSLRWLSLGLGASAIALQYVSLPIASQVVLGEVISPLRWIGIGIVTVGLIWIVVAAGLEA